MLIKAGSTLLVPRPASQEDDVGAHLADHAQLTLAPEGRGQRRLTLRIGRKGESVASVARRHRVSAVQVARWNDVSPRARFKAGQRVVVMVSTPAPRKARPARAVAAKKTTPSRKAAAGKTAARKAAARQAAARQAAAVQAAADPAAQPR
jgi:membrane-bound lytic murein transglycosylase D